MSALRRLRASVTSTVARRSHSQEAMPTTAQLPVLSSSAPLLDRLNDAEARATAYVRMLAECDAEVVRLQLDVKYRSRRLVELSAQNEQLQADLANVRAELAKVLKLRRGLI